jgi:hypothetical protein
MQEQPDLSTRSVRRERPPAGHSGEMAPDAGYLESRELSPAYDEPDYLEDTYLDETYPGETYLEGTYLEEVDAEEIWGPRPRLHASDPGGRRTVVITGRVADRHIAPRAGTRDHLPGHARYGFQADRTAMWAVLLCVIVLLCAITSH